MSLVRILIPTTLALCLGAGVSLAQEAEQPPEEAIATETGEADVEAAAGVAQEPDEAAEGAESAVDAAAAPPEPATEAEIEVHDRSLVGDASAGETKAAVCAACHGPGGNATDPQYPKLAGQNEAYTARQLVQFKTQQRVDPVMFGFAVTLSQQDMHDLGAFFATQDAVSGVADEALVERGQQLWRGGDAELGVPACMACHGPDGRGMAGAAYPALAGQWASYVEAKFAEWRDGKTWGSDTAASIMPEIAQRLSAGDIAAVSSYIEGLHTADSGVAATR